MCTANTANSLDSDSIAQSNISTNTDLIILLRYVEIYGESERGLAILKMRGSKHEQNIHEFSINRDDMRIGQTLRNIVGILSGNLTYIDADGIDRLDDLQTEI